MLARLAGLLGGILTARFQRRGDRRTLDMREVARRLEGSIAELRPAPQIIDPTNKNPRAAPAARGFFLGFTRHQKQNPTGASLWGFEQ